MFWNIVYNMQPKMFSSCDALPYHWNPTSHGRESGIAPVQRFSHFKHPPAQVFCATYISRLQVLRQWGSGEATGGDAVDGSSHIRSIYTICVICTGGRPSPPSTFRLRTPPLSSLYPSDKCELPVPRLRTDV